MSLARDQDKTQVKRHLCGHDLLCRGECVLAIVVDLLTTLRCVRSASRHPGLTGHMCGHERKSVAMDRSNDVVLVATIVCVVGLCPCLLAFGALRKVWV